MILKQESTGTCKQVIVFSFYHYMQSVDARRLMIDSFTLKKGGCCLTKLVMSIIGSKTFDLYSKLGFDYVVKLSRNVTNIIFGFEQ